MEHPNVFILSFDSLRASSFTEASEEIADLIDGRNFTNAIAPASHTTSSMPPLTTGTFSDALPTWGLPSSGEPKPAAEYFAELGYTCGLWTDNYLFGAEYNYDRGFNIGNRGQPTTRKRIANYVKNSPLRSLFGVMEWGYFNMYQQIKHQVGSESSFYRSAADLNEEYLDWLDSRPDETPVFSWIHYMDNHHPYEAPTEYLERQSFRDDRSRSELGEFSRNAIKSNGSGLNANECHDLECAYEATCEYAADQVIDLVETLIERGEYNKHSDVLVVTADHGECLDPEPYGMLGHVPPAFWEDIVKVPLIIGRPDWEPGTDDRHVSLVDLLPTILGSIDGEIAGDRQIADPSDLHRDITRFVSQWEHYESGEIRTYRGVRREDGSKCFGAFRKNEDQIVCAGLENGTEVIHNAWERESFTPDLLSDEWAELHQMLVDEGGAVQYESVSSQETKLDEEHLRDLGYLE